MISTDQIREILKNKGINVAKMASDPQVFETACSLVYKSIPIPARWFVGKGRVRSLLSKVQAQATKVAS